MLKKLKQQLRLWIVSNDLGDIVFLVLWLGIAAVMVLVLVTASGCATGTRMPPPRVGSCLVDEKDQWYCVDPNGEVTLKVGRYACFKLEEWADMIKYWNRLDQ